MAPTNRRRFTGLLAGSSVPSIAANLTNSDGTITFPAALTYGGGQAVPTIADPDYVALTIDPDKDTEEVVWLTAYTSGATTGTIVRGKEGTTGVAHTSPAKVLHGPTADDPGYLVAGDPASYTFVSGDTADPASWWGHPTFIKILPTWTPEVSGDFVLALGPDNGDSDYAANNFDIYFFKGDVANTDYPDATAASGSWNGPSIDVYPSSSIASQHIDGGQPYTIVLVDWNAAGHTIPLAGLYNSLYSFGGFDTVPPPFTAPSPASAVVARPDGRMARRFVLDRFGAALNSFIEVGGGASATARGSHAEGGGTASGFSSHAEGSGTASGDHSHAEGENTTASGPISHAEGEGTTASGYFAHAEGYVSTASGDQSHAEGNTTTASGQDSHAEGHGAVAWRPAEHATASGTAGGNASQASYLTLTGTAAGGSAAPIVVAGGVNPTTPDLPLTPFRVSAVRGMIQAKDHSGNRAAWEYKLLAEQGGTGTLCTLVGTPSVTQIFADSAATGWTVAITAVTNGLQVHGTGSGSTNTDWAATAEILELA